MDVLLLLESTHPCIYSWNKVYQALTARFGYVYDKTPNLWSKIAKI